MVGVVPVEHLVDRRVEHEGALVEVETPGAEAAKVTLVVRDEKSVRPPASISSMRL